ncbi:MAG: hypothetical protein H0X27_11120 [Caulobacteraceae bacterium]|nr:hypothetical protein [Caulobacteraceae bacterium]
MKKRPAIGPGALGAGALLAILPTAALHAAPSAAPEVRDEVRHDLSLPLRYLVRITHRDHLAAPRAIPLRPIPVPAPLAGAGEDGALQSSMGAPVGTVDGLNFAGVGEGDYGYSDSFAPPDTNAAVGATQYVQIVNSSFGIFDKTTGALLLPIANTNTIWAGFGGTCDNNNDGDGIVKYDRIANRWVITQLAVSSTPFTECVAVSKTSDATGAYNRYAFTYGTDFNDYPKFGVWPDGYYVTYNIFANGQFFTGAKLCALDRRKMLHGKKAKQHCFQLSSAFGGVLPSDLDGATLPPTGAPNYMVNFGRNSLNLWKFHVDFATPANSTLTGPTNLAVPAFTALCGGGTCVPQKGGSTLDSLADRLMYRLAYRNFGDHEALVVNHSVSANGVGGVRWYELRSPGASPTLFQSGTFAPNKLYRWMGSVAMDKAGDMAVGYSESSSKSFPSIAYTGRLPSDPPGTLQGEKIVKAGGGSQNGGLSRWGDYTAMTLDPVDDCTFFYTNEYLKANGSFNWSTQINTFKFPNCQ